MPRRPPHPGDLLKRIRELARAGKVSRFIGLMQPWRQARQFVAELLLAAATADRTDIIVRR